MQTVATAENSSRVCTKCRKMALFIQELHCLLEKYGKGVPKPQEKTGDGPSCSEALSAFVESKRQSNRRPEYVRGIHAYLRGFIAGREDSPVKGMTTRDVELWFRERDEPPPTMLSNIGRFNSFFSFCIRREWMSQNPCDRVERPRADMTSPIVLTVDQCRTAFRRVADEQPDLVVPLVLGMFCGLRPVEAQQTTWDDIHLDTATVVVNGTQSKTRRRRMVPLPANAMEFLPGLRSSNAMPIHRTGWRRMTGAMSGVLGFDHWPHDALRHTAASMMLAREQDAGKVALWLGNSPAVLLRHYIVPIHADDCSAFWRITP